MTDVPKGWRQRLMSAAKGIDIYTATAQITRVNRQRTRLALGDDIGKNLLDALLVKVLVLTV